MQIGFRLLLLISLMFLHHQPSGKPGKMGRHFPVREKSGNFEQTGKVREKVRENHTEYWKTSDLR